jgi:hypothetical protein
LTQRLRQADRDLSTRAENRLHIRLYNS